MGKAKSKGLDVNVNAYKWKQIQYKYGGELPPEVRNEMIEDMTNIQLLNYEMGYGTFNRVWREAVVPTLVEKGVKSPFWGPYKAFTNELLKKALGLGREKPTMTIDEVKSKWVSLGANKDVIDAIVSAIQSKGKEMGLFA